MDRSRAYLALETGQLIALDRATGAPEWSVRIDSSWPPVTDGETVYAAGGDRLHALRASTGASLWEVALGSPLAAPLALGGGRLIAVAASGTDVRALDARDGRPIWRRVLGSPARPAGLVAVAIDAASVYVSFGSRLIRMEATDGRLRWERELPGMLTAPAVTRDRVFVGSTDNGLYALNPRDGRVLWRFSTGGDIVGATADSRYVYVASLDQLLRALHRGSGNQVWKRALSTRTTAAPLAFGGIVAVSGNAPILSTFDAATGMPVAALPAPAGLQGTLGTVLIDPSLRPFSVAMIGVSRDGRAVGLRPSGMMFREHPLRPLEVLPGRMLDRERRPRPNGDHRSTGPESPDEAPSPTRR